VTAPAEFQADADDLGEYRIGGLPEGRYTVAPVTPPNNRPGATASVPPEPVTVSLRAGDEFGDINFVVDVPPAPRIVTPAPGDGDTSSIRGRITTAGGQPIAGALVRPVPGRGGSGSALSDAQGRYVISGVPSGDYRVEASRNGYITFQYGQTATSRVGRTVAVGADQAVDRIDIALPRMSAIAGTVVDEYGEPLHDVAVDVLHVQSVAGRVRALRARGRRTDDRGRYRVWGLPPGSYVVRVQVNDAVADSDTRGYPPLYYPGRATVEEATRIGIEMARDVTNADVVVRPTPAMRVSGQVVDASGTPVRARIAMMISERSGAIQVEPTMEESAEDGSFAINNVPPGDYVIQAFGPPQLDASGRPGTGPEFAARFLTITDEAPPPLRVQLTRGVTLTGRVTIDGQGTVPVSGVSLRAIPADFDRAPMIGSGSLGFTVEQDGRFRYAGLTGPRRIVFDAGPASSLYLKSASVRGVDVSEQPFDFGMDSATIDNAEVVLSMAGALLSGAVTNDRATAVSDYSVVVFSTDPARWFAGSQRLKLAPPPLQDGTFRVFGLPPDEYWVIAVDRIEGGPGGGEWQEAAVLRTLSSQAVRLSVTEGENRSLTLRLVTR
jgi:protocatechuate 3,4-dioxygenase beta subunit